MPPMETSDDRHDRLSIAPDLDQLEEVVESIEGTEAQFKDKLFNEYAKQTVLTVFFERLSEFIDPDDMDRMQAVLADCTEDEILSVISLPEQLTNQNFTKFEEKIAGGVSPEEVIREYIEKVSKYKFSIGFHTSPYNIRPNSETGEWVIKGKQKDHRDDDRVMAYYSKQYRHIYKKDGSKYVYIVRASGDDKTDDNWYRNAMLNIITRMKLHDVMQYVEAHARKRKSSDEIDSPEP